MRKNIYAVKVKMNNTMTLDISSNLMLEGSLTVVK